MQTFYRQLIPIALWLGIAVFLLVPLAILMGKGTAFGLAHLHVARELWWLPAEWVKRGNRHYLLLPASYPE